MDQLDEYEQGERVRTWLRQNGSSLITGIALGLLCVSGWQWWQGKGVRHQAEAATQFTALTDAIEAKDEAKTKTFAEVIAKDYGDTGYAELAALRYAGFLQSQDKTDAALAQLQAAEPKVTDPDMKELFDLRWARLLLIAGKAEEAGKRLDAVGGTPRFQAIAEELRGDIETALGHRELARKAYLQALTTLDQAAPTRRLVELKLIESGGKPPAQPEI